MIRFPCPHCQKKLKDPERSAGPHESMGRHVLSRNGAVSTFGTGSRRTFTATKGAETAPMAPGVLLSRRLAVSLSGRTDQDFHALCLLWTKIPSVASILRVDSLAFECGPQLLGETAGQPEERFVRHEMPPIRSCDFRMSYIPHLDQLNAPVKEIEQKNAVADFVRMSAPRGVPPVVSVIPVRRL